MKPMNSLRKLAVGSGFLGAFLLAAQGQIPWATEEFSRQNKFEVYGVGQYLHQDDAEYHGSLGTTKLKLDDTGLGGFGLAFHINDYLAVHADFMLGPATFNVVEPGRAPYELGDDAFVQTGRFNVDYNIINRRLTPFITAGIGYQYLQAQQYYYYYGWYHYGHYYNYYDETDFTWNVGAGLRWNITDNFFMKVTGGAQWVLYNDADNIPTQIEASIAIGGTFP